MHTTVTAYTDNYIGRACINVDCTFQISIFIHAGKHYYYYYRNQFQKRS